MRSQVMVGVCLLVSLQCALALAQNNKPGKPYATESTTGVPLSQGVAPSHAAGSLDDAAAELAAQLASQGPSRKAEVVKVDLTLNPAEIWVALGSGDGAAVG